MFCSKCGHSFEGKFCPDCGHESGTPVTVTQASVAPMPPRQTIIIENAPIRQARFLPAKLAIGVISIVWSVFITFQSCAAGFVNAWENTGSASGSMGMLVSICWLVAGIVGIAGRKSIGACWTACGIYAVAGVFALTDIGVFKELMVYAIASFVFAAVFGVSTFKKGSNGT